MNKKYVFNNWIMGAWKCGRTVMEVRSIGHKWVWLGLSGRKQITKISRTEWNQIAASDSFEELAA